MDSKVIFEAVVKFTDGTVWVAPATNFEIFSKWVTVTLENNFGVEKVELSNFREWPPRVE